MTFSRITSLVIAASALLAAQAQLSVTATATDFTIDFDNTVSGVNNGAFDGSGFDPAPAAGDLDGDAFALTGFGTNHAFGNTTTSGDMARGSSTGGVGTGGVYAFDVGSSDYALGVQPAGSDFTPGTITLLVTNNTGSTVTSVDVDYEIWEFNDQGRANSLNFAWSTDDVTYTDEAALDFTTTQAAGGGSWVLHSRTITIGGLSLANGSSIYLRWIGDDETGSGSRDEYAIDDIVVNMTGGGGPTTQVQFAAPTSSTVLENAGNTDLTVEISNPDPGIATSVDVVLISGDATRIDNYTTQTVNWAAADGTDKTVTITITDDGLLNGDEVLTFELQNATGGASATVGANSQYVLTVQDDEVATSVQFQTVSNTITETGVSFDLVLDISDPSGTSATTCDVVLLTGDAGRIGSYTTQAVNFPAGSSASQNVTVTITDDLLCNGGEDYIFEIQNVAGGTSAAAGANTVFSSKLNDDEGLSAGADDDLELGNILPWTEGVAGHWDASTTMPINGTYSLKHNLSSVAGNSYISRDVNTDLNLGASTWRLQMMNGSWDPSSGNRFWFWLSANESDLSSTSIDGYAVGVNYNGSDDLLSLWRIDNNGGTKIITSAFNWGADDVVGIEVTRDAKGNWELLIDTDGGFDALVSAGTVTDQTHSENVAIGAEFVYTSTRAGLLWFDDISFSTAGCFVTYYSQGSGNIDDNIWDVVPVGVGGPAMLVPTSSFVVQNGHTVTQNLADVEAYDLDIQSGGVYSSNAVGNELSIFSSLNVDGTLTGDPLDIFATGYGTSYTFGGTEANLLVSPINSLNFANSDAQITDGGWTVKNELTVEGSSVDLGGNSLILDSDVNGTARIGDLSGGTLVNASAVTMRRYIPAGVTNWRALGSPMTSQTLAELDDDFFTAGFPGSNYPLFYTNNDPMQPLWPSIRNYDEANMGAVLLDGLEGPADVSDAMGVGEGFVAWAGDNFVSTADFVIDFTGTPNSGFINLPMSYTSTGDITVDGWNLVANPLPSPIDFSALILGADVENNYFVYDPISGNNAAWNETLGISVPAGALNGNIQSSQSFWLHAVGASNTASVTESAKVNEPIAGGLFGGNQLNQLDMLRLKISSGINTYYDESVLVFENGSDTFEGADLQKFIFNNGSSPQIAMETSDGQTVAINDYGTFSSALSIPVQVDVPVSGTYTITLFDAESVLGMSCVSLEDLTTGTTIPLVEGATYDFVINANDPVSPARFVLHVSAPATLAQTDAQCYGTVDGSASITNPTNATWTVDWLDDMNNLIVAQTVTNGTTTITGLAAGDYSAVVSGGCGQLVNEFTIGQPGAMGASVNVDDASCAGMNDAFVDLVPQGGVAPLSFMWSNGSTDEDLMNVPAGSYDVLITDANGCQYVHPTFMVAAGPGPAITVSASATSVLTNEPVDFQGTAPSSSTVEWNMGDGTYYNTVDPTHSYTLPGVYTASFTADLNGCVNIGTIDIDVSTSTNVEEQSATGISAYAFGEDILISWNLSGYNAQLLDVTGKIIVDRIQLNGEEGTTTVDMSDQPGGVYFLLLQSADDTQTLRVPLVK